MNAKPSRSSGSPVQSAPSAGSPAGPAPETLEMLLADESLRGLRQAWHVLEAFQLSTGHRVLKERLRTRLAAAIFEER
ncbi:hypothetical protein OpiT1DRAFT_00014 [Opitutaceae bacterium TAV1]|nr:hypothetical protein OPIT5_01190 [Opitutaceae bacterium TAV5]EIQ01411.1 hypothetical protein OpiT1DRAFT_05987 [Opitutaceae bacterium TAV1]EIQ01445.1 hypothetical protein OpiT1DRAFT_00014 [Opitutaceae bacterium TAV1]